MRRIIAFLLIVVSATTALAQQRSAKRGVCWDEGNLALSAAVVDQMAPGISWVYNWGATTSYTSMTQMAFVPMAWNGDFNETQLRNYLSSHAGQVKYLLGFNEPNLTWSVGGANMTPAQAAAAWPRLEQIAADFHLELVAPALNFTGDKVGDRVWEPFAWYDEFFRLLPTARVDELAFHSYMNYYSAVRWVTTEYFYTDKEDSDLFASDNRAKYPHLVAYLENFKTANGHYPRMFLTEFCSWGTNDYPYQAGITLDFQIDQMVQKLQVLEQSDLVAGYAWFMGNPKGGASEFPYMSLFQTCSATSQLSTLGQVYVHMSSFDTEKYYTPDELILAKDYVNASMDNQVPRVLPNSESGSTVPLQVELTVSAWTTYQINMPAAGDYQLTLHMKSTASNQLGFYGPGFKRIKFETVASTGGQWADVKVTLPLPAGPSELTVYNAQSPSVVLNSLKLTPDPSSGIDALPADPSTLNPQRSTFYDLNGRRVEHPTHGIYILNGKKVYIK